MGILRPTLEYRGNICQIFRVNCIDDLRFFVKTQILRNMGLDSNKEFISGFHPDEALGEFPIAE